MLPCFQDNACPVLIEAFTYIAITNNKLQCNHTISITLML